MHAWDLEYWRLRADQERLRSDGAATPEAAAAHRRLRDEYLALIAAGMRPLVVGSGSDPEDGGDERPSPAPERIRGIGARSGLRQR